MFAAHTAPSAARTSSANGNSVVQSPGRNGVEVTVPCGLIRTRRRASACVIAHRLPSGPVATPGPKKSSTASNGPTSDRLPAPSARTSTSEAENQAWPSGPIVALPASRCSETAVRNPPPGAARPTESRSGPLMPIHAPPSGPATSDSIEESSGTRATSEACAGALIASATATARIEV